MLRYVNGGKLDARPGAAQAWIDRLRQDHVDLLFIAMPAPPELRWVEQNPASFSLIKGEEGYRIYQIRPS